LQTESLFQKKQKNSEPKKERGERGENEKTLRDNLAGLETIIRQSSDKKMKS